VVWEDLEVAEVAEERLRLIPVDRVQPEHRTAVEQAEVVHLLILLVPELQAL
jgi:hypothetical protein